MGNKKGSNAINISEIPMMEVNNIFAANLVWMDRGIGDEIATFDLVVREMPDKWSFYVMDGIERFLDVLTKYGFDDESVEILKKMGFINSREAEKFYREFRFTGDVFAMKDGTVFYPGEPIVRITAPLLEANLLTAFLLNIFSYPIRIMSKMARWKLATQDRSIFLSGAMMRLPGIEQGYYVAKDAFLLGSPPVSPLIYKKFPRYEPQDNKITANLNHAVIKSFPTEREAYRYIFDELDDKINMASVMVDTYDAKKGLEIFIEEFKKRRELDQKKFFVAIDSGEIDKEVKRVRKKLDESGLEKIGLNVMSNLDENLIDSLLSKGMRIEVPETATEQVNITDNPRLEAVYKMAEIIHSDGSVEEKAKLAKGKESYPGRKQVFREFKDGKMSRDVIGYEQEDLGEPLLEKFIEKGELIKTIPSLEETKENLERNLSMLPDKCKKLKKSALYKVEISKNLKSSLDKIRRNMSNS